MNTTNEYEVIYGHPAVEALTEKAKELGLMFHIHGIPFGAEYATHLQTLGLPKHEVWTGEGSCRPDTTGSVG
jgi:hypothetical protein